MIKGVWKGRNLLSGCREGFPGEEEWGVWKGGFAPFQGAGKDFPL